MGHLAAEFSHIDAFHLAGRQGNGRRVHVLAVDTGFVVQVRAGGAAGAADVADDVASFHAAADRRVSAHVAVQGFHAVGVLQHHGVAVAAFPATEGDVAVGRGANRGAFRRGIVDTGVHSDRAEHRMHARAVR